METFEAIGGIITFVLMHIFFAASLLLFVNSKDKIWAIYFLLLAIYLKL